MVLSMVSCKIKTETEKNLIKMKENIQLDIRESFLKNNIKVVSLDIICGSYDTITENTLDSVRMNRLLDKAQEHITKGKELGEKCEDYANEIKMYNLLGLKDLEKITKTQLNKTATEMKAQSDSSKIFIMEAESLEQNIKERTSPKKLYKLRCFIEAVFKFNMTNETFDYSDEKYYIFEPLTLDIIPVNN